MNRPVGMKLDGTTPVASDGRLHTTKKVGGGTWNYGSSTKSIGKTCWSNYTHSGQHGSTVYFNGVSRHAQAIGGTSVAQLSGIRTAWCTAYWHVGKG